MINKLRLFLPALAATCLASCAGPSSSDRFTYVDMEKLPRSSALHFQDHAAFEIRQGNGGYALVDLHQPKSRYGVMYLEKYPLNTLTPSEAASMRKIMEKSMTSGKVDKWIIIQMSSYASKMVGIYQRDDDQMDLTKRPRTYGWEKPGSPDPFELYTVSPTGKIVPASSLPSPSILP